MQNEIMVSVICNTYNHEKYIRSALDGFINQITNFQYEVLIHDDASTDGTAEIIRQYSSQRPDLLFPIFEHENQYSKDIPISQTYQFPRVRGKYIALCEGDDFWTDPHKLQKQYDAMEKHSDVDICAHSSLREQDGTIVGSIAPSNKMCIFSTEEVIDGGGGFVATASLFYRAELERMDNYPLFRKMFQLDYFLQIHGALRGGLLYLPDNMATYRVATEGSWTIRMRKNKEKKCAHHERVLNSLLLLDAETKGLYETVIRKSINEVQFEIDYLKGNYIALLDKKYKAMFHDISLKKKAFIFVMAVIQKLNQMYKN